MQERSSPTIGAYQVRALTSPSPCGGWLASGQIWFADKDGQRILLAQVDVGPEACEQAAVDQAYDRAYTTTLRMILREFACF